MIVGVKTIWREEGPVRIIQESQNNIINDKEV